MTPDFAEFLLQTPEAERVGLVFKLNVAGNDGSPDRSFRGQVGFRNRGKGGASSTRLTARKPQSRA